MTLQGFAAAAATPLSRATIVALVPPVVAVFTVLSFAEVLPDPSTIAMLSSRASSGVS